MQWWCAQQLLPSSLLAADGRVPKGFALHNAIDGGAGAGGGAGEDGRGRVNGGSNKIRKPSGMHDGACKTDDYDEDVRRHQVCSSMSGTGSCRWLGATEWAARSRRASKQVLTGGKGVSSYKLSHM